MAHNDNMPGENTRISMEELSELRKNAEAHLDKAQSALFDDSITDDEALSHLDAALAHALALFTAPAGAVEAEAVRRVAPNLAQRQLGIQLANGVEDPGVRSRVAHGTVADRRLIDVDDLVDVFDTGDAVMSAGDQSRTVDACGERVIDDRGHQRAFAAP